jgi:hypothetical protein
MSEILKTRRVYDFPELIEWFKTRFAFIPTGSAGVSYFVNCMMELADIHTMNIARTINDDCVRYGEFGPEDVFSVAHLEFIRALHLNKELTIVYDAYIRSASTKEGGLDRFIDTKMWIISIVLTELNKRIRPPPSGDKTSYATALIQAWYKANDLPFDGTNPKYLHEFESEVKRTLSEIEDAAIAQSMKDQKKKRGIFGFLTARKK